MSKFNKATIGTRTENLAGGEAYTETPELELVSLLLTSFVSDKYYESASDQLKRLHDLVHKIKDKKFIGQAAVYARNEFGMRSITHALVRELVRDTNKKPWIKNAVAKSIKRPDDMLEILSYYLETNDGKKSIANSLKKGLSMALSKFNAYQLAKYRGEGKGVKLVDLVNLVHPKPTKDQTEAFKKLVEGELKSTETWEAKLSQAGKVEAENEEEKTVKVAENKKEAWGGMLEGNKLGYFALLRNVRNILEQAPELADKVAERLVDEKTIRNSLILPFQFKKAYDAVAQVNFKGTRKMLGALDKAVDLSVANCPEFPGKTLVVLDVSGSMDGQPREIGSLFLAAFAKRNPDCDTMVFHDSAQYFTVNPNSLITDIIEKIPSVSGGTNFHAIFEEADKAYDRIVILSDMQGWIGYDSPVATFNAYKKKYGCNPKIFSFDLQGYGSLQFPQDNIYCMAGFSDRTLELMKMLETDRNILIDKIRAVEL